MSDITLPLVCRNMEMPAYKSRGAAGIDLAANEDVLIPAGQTRSIATGVFVAIPSGYEGQIRGRSGLAFNHQIFSFTGTIDSDYRGEVRGLLLNTSGVDYQVKAGDRIAQLVVAPVVHCILDFRSKLPETTRGIGGFGSTGK